MGNSQPVQKQPDAVKLGILSVARISPNAVIAPANKLSSVEITGVASRDINKAKQFASKYGIPKAYGSYEELLNDPEIEAVYIPLPNGMHYEWTMKALKAGKHVLCEKPFANNEEEAIKMRDEAIKQKKTLVEAFHYQYHPLATRIREIIQSGEIGAIKHISSEFCLASYIALFASEAKENDIRFQYKLGGGIAMDAGCYPISAIRFASGLEPKATSAKAETISPNVDHTMEADFSFDNGSTAHMRCSFRNPGINPFIASLDIKGEKGSLSVTNFLAPSYYHSLKVSSDSKSRTEKVYGSGQTTYFYQLEAFAKEIRGGPKCPTDGNHGILNMRVIDQVYSKAGLPKRGTTL